MNKIVLRFYGTRLRRSEVLLILGVLFLIIGVQMVTTGLIAEMMNYRYRNFNNDGIVDERIDS